MESTLLQHSYYIVLAPAVAFCLILIFGKWVGLQGAWLGVAALLYGFIHSSLIAIGIYTGSVHLPMEGLQGHYFESSMAWFSVGDFEFRLGLLIDGLSSLMLVVVTFVALLVQIYSLSYMHDHKRFGRYFAYVNLFTFSMLILVVANNMLQFFIGWELVGLCSYLLIGFDFEREAAAYAGRKAFITTKIGDLGMYIGLLLIFNYLGTFNIVSLQQNLSSVSYPSWLLTTIPLLLFFGAMGKSAQVPLHVWLPDAMEGPTPASALIHAATMVAAGVYMVARIFFMFEASPISMDVVAWVGVTTAIVAASMGLVASDIKRNLAFSTVSQLGFMMAALGCGGYAAGMFHLTTHAAFKALLFLCAGSVIHAVHTNDMWKMGGLLTKMPVTAATYFIATLAIAGFPFTSGFYSKEEILASALHRSPVFFTLLAVAALMTSFYMFRSWFLTFTGNPRDKEKFHHAHESPLLMTIPLVILAVPSLILGFFFWYQHNLEKWVSWGEHGAVPHEGHLVLLVSFCVFLGGFLGAFFLYYGDKKRYEVLGVKLNALHSFIYERYKFDEVYLWVIGNIYHPFSRWLANFDYEFIDQGVVDGFGRVAKRFSWISNLFDGAIVDRLLVDGQGDIFSALGTRVRKWQSGFVQSYLFWIMIGVGALLFWMVQSYK